MQIGLGEDDCACIAQIRDDGTVLACAQCCQGSAAAAGWEVMGADVVLENDRDAVKSRKRLVSLNQGLGFFIFLSRSFYCVVVDANEGLYGWVVVSDALEVCANYGCAASGLLSQCGMEGRDGEFVDTQCSARIAHGWLVCIPFGQGVGTSTVDKIISKSWFTQHLVQVCPAHESPRHRGYLTCP